MTNEEIQRVMEFIIKQQESFADRMEQMRENLEQMRENLEQMRELHEARIGSLESAFVNVFNVVTEIGKAQKTLTETVTDLAEAQAHTDQRVNVLIDIIEQGRNGKSEG